MHNSKVVYGDDYTWVLKIHDLPVMTSARMDTEFSMLSAPWIHLSSDRSLFTPQELYKHITETCVQGIEVIWSMNRSLFLIGSENVHYVSYQGNHVYWFIHYHVGYRKELTSAMYYQEKHTHDP